ncbi:hypothetical protein GLOIN_2v1886741 [Rhizophagus clarus]|uniref:Uncharacterized protein n=1 Tax=Rhizophagus clarus TaxID=94130 RepID=A0A8H3KRZ9_9GLOM|nr:hypothetical protein GLOIN_2v1886741 [Rhizophagus clarus]
MQSKIENHTEYWPEVCWIIENPDLNLPIPNLIDADENQYKRLSEFLNKIIKLKDDQSLIITIYMSYNKAFNYVKLNYTKKKIDYPKSYWACHTFSVIHNTYIVL